MMMQYRYLYRAKRIDNGEWVEGYLSYPFCMEKGNESYYFYAKDSLDFFCRCVVDASTICQCTGVKDKNGKLIWENDIVSYCDCTKEDYVIAWEQNKACFEYQEYSCSMMNFDELSGCEVEVIGNIFDNLELLDEEL